MTKEMRQQIIESIKKLKIEKNDTIFVTVSKLVNENDLKEIENIFKHYLKREVIIMLNIGISIHKSLNFKQYQKASNLTSQYPKKKEIEWLYPVLGLAGESGEVVEKFKKIFRDKNNKITQKDKQEIGKELGDVLWYVAQICEVIGLDMNDVAKLNLKKLLDRKKRNKIKGDGDNR